MRRMHYCLIVFICILVVTLGQIHRTGHHKYKHKELNNDHYCSNEKCLRPVTGYSQEVWTYSLLSAFAVGLSGVLPIFIISVDSNVVDTNGSPSSFLKLLLGFSVGGLLGDVFLHLLPEAYDNCKTGDAAEIRSIGINVLLGLMFCLFIEKLAYNAIKSSTVNGWLNLLANFMDNFTHGLAVAGSFAVSLNGGIMTTCVILLHEVPHELGDFAILLRSGFSRWDAGKAQFITGFGGMCGAVFGLMCESMELAGQKTSFLLPFTSGCFINVALVTIVPDLIEESDLKESLKQILSMIIGISVMWYVSIYLDAHNLDFTNLPILTST